jgi:hypothetical protein
VGLLGLDRLGFTFCVFKLATGLPCPTCGSTRALGRLAHLDLAGAVAMNPLAAAFSLVLVLWGLGDALVVTRGKALRLRVPETWRLPLRLAALLAVVLNWVFLLAVSR